VSAGVAGAKFVVAVAVAAATFAGAAVAGTPSVVAAAASIAAAARQAGAEVAGVAAEVAGVLSAGLEEAVALAARPQKALGAAVVVVAGIGQRG